MNEVVKPKELVPSGITNSQPSAASPLLPLDRSPNLADRGDRIVINDGVLAGLYGLRLQSLGNGRCFVQLERKGPHLLVEIDDTLVDRAS